MADSQTLTTGTNSGTQTSTDSPQSATSSGFSSGAPSSAVQPVVGGSQLNTGGTNGIPLQNNQVTTVNLSQTSTAVTHATTTPQATHQTNPVLAGIAIVLFVVALGLYWYTNHSSKNTTN